VSGGYDVRPRSSVQTESSSNTGGVAGMDCSGVTLSKAEEGDRTVGQN